MKTNGQKLRHLRGDEAYLIYWQQFYKSEAKLSFIKVLDLNLQIIVDSNNNLLAFWHELPEEMKGMLANTGEWRMFVEVDWNPELTLEVRNFIDTLN